MNHYIAPWHIFIHFEAANTPNNPIVTPEIYYS